MRLHPLASAVLAAAALAGKALGKPSTQQTCNTFLGPKSVRPVPTQTKRSTATDTIRSTTCVRPTVVVTPSPITVTLTEVATATLTATATPETDTVQVDTTQVVDVTSTADPLTVTVTASTSTDTTVTPTSTVPAPAGFQPIQQVIGGASNALPDGVPAQPKQRRNTTKRQPAAAAEEAAAVEEPALAARGGAPKYPTTAPKKYPSRVECTAVTRVSTVRVSTKTERADTVTAPAPVHTATRTDTVTVTTTEYPDHVTVETTSTVETTVTHRTTPVTSSTTTQTLTNTVALPAATVYAVCQDRTNYADRLGDNIFVGLDDQAGYRNEVHTATDTPYACCHLCASSAECALAVWYIGYGGDPSRGGTCLHYDARTARGCTAASPCGGLVWGYHKDRRPGPVYDVVAFEGAAGRWRYLQL